MHCIFLASSPWAALTLRLMVCGWSRRRAIARKRAIHRTVA
jgi:hypothetical protein